MKKFLTVLLGLFLSSTSFANTPFEVSLQTNPFGGGAGVRIISDVDGLVIHKVVVNRGKCGKVFTNLTNRLNFSDYTIYWANGCRVKDIREIIVSTNKGEYSFSPRRK